MRHPADRNRRNNRWAAIGAAVAVTIGGGGVGLVSATTSSGPRAIYQPINPCRLADLRPAPFTVGPRPAPLGEQEILTLDGWGDHGDCSLPSGTSGLALNVTAVDPTAPTFFRLWPTGETQPGTSNLNPTPGSPPTPNAVNVGLSPTGQFDILNRFGNVSVIIDVVGVYDDHRHDDRYYSKAQVDAAVASAIAAAVPIIVVEQANDSRQLVPANVGGAGTTVRSATIEAPSSGRVIAEGSVWVDIVTGAVSRCSLTQNTFVESFESVAGKPDPNNEVQISPIRSFDVDAGQVTVNFVCLPSNSAAAVAHDAVLKLTFVPD